MIHVPTHLSNLDSVVFGFALERGGLPPATYGAGKNLFTNPVLSYFMHNLGAYRVDRRLRHALYKDVLKAYSCVLIERGFHSLFFPGGTRSRSGGVERRAQAGTRRHRRRSVRRDDGTGENAAGLLRTFDDQLPSHARGGDAHRRLPRRGREGPLHHRGRRIGEGFADRDFHQQAPRPRRRVRGSVLSAARLLRERGRRGRRLARRTRASD